MARTLNAGKPGRLAVVSDGNCSSFVLRDTLLHGGDGAGRAGDHAFHPMVDATGRVGIAVTVLDCHRNMFSRLFKLGSDPIVPASLVREQIEGAH